MYRERESAKRRKKDGKGVKENKEEREGLREKGKDKISSE